MKKYDLIVLGGGPGGYVAAIRAAQYGLKVAVIEEDEMGGTCLNWGCIPTKSLLHSAELYNSTKHFSESGISVKDVSFDYSKIAQKKDSVVKKLRSGVEYLVKSNGIDIIKGKGTLTDKNTVSVEGSTKNTINADKIIIATGSKPFKPPIEGIEGKLVLDSNDVLSLKECPDKIIIIGGGVIGVEFATVFNSLGKEVVIIEMMDYILPGIDKDISIAVRKSLEKKGVKIFTGSKVTRIKSENNAVCVFECNEEEKSIEADFVFVAIGRKPNTQNIGLENVGIKTERGNILVNDKMETTVEGIFAIGDVTGKVLLAHIASQQGLVAADNATGKNKKMDYSIIPSCIYTNPEIACVGITEEKAKENSLNYRVGMFPISGNGKSLIMGEQEGFIKAISDAQTGEILGVHIFSPRATDIISEICVAIKLESTVEEIADTIHPHPTISEIIMESMHDIEGYCVHKPKKK